MHNEPRVDEDIGEKLCDVLSEVVFDHPDLSHSEALLALQLTIGLVLVNIECPDCRKHAAKATAKTIKRIIADALKQAAKHDAMASHAAH